jgi:hypothetical protein
MNYERHTRSQFIVHSASLLAVVGVLANNNSLRIFRLRQILPPAHALRQCTAPERGARWVIFAEGEN